MKPRFERSESGGIAPQTNRVPERGGRKGQCIIEEETHAPILFPSNRRPQ